MVKELKRNSSPINPSNQWPNPIPPITCQYQYPYSYTWPAPSHLHAHECFAVLHYLLPCLMPHLVG